MVTVMLVYDRESPESDGEATRRTGASPACQTLNAVFRDQHRRVAGVATVAFGNADFLRGVLPVGDLVRLGAR